VTADPEGTLSRALAYARHGWPVFPCQPGGKEPAARHGFLDASTDPGQIAWWWERQPLANLAIATGLPGPDVLDVDQRGPAGSGFAAFNLLNHARLLGGAGAIVATPGGGVHAYFTGSTQPSGRLPRHHLDFKARGGYVLAPPSRVNGRPYRLIASRPAAGPLDWLAVTGLVEPERQRSRQVEPRLLHGDPGHLAAWVERLPEGNRNSGLFWAACRAVEAGQPASLDDLVAAAAKSGLTNREINRTIASAKRTCRSGRQPEREAVP
jgi:Bifunctional DNA primase/polymerase, N-terminal